MKNKYAMIFILFLSGCVNCATLVENFRKKDIEMIINKKYIKYQKQINFEGVNLKGDAAYFDEIGFRPLYEIVEIGDTLIKKEGALTLEIHRKDTVLTHNVYCDGKLYK